MLSRAIARPHFEHVGTVVIRQALLPKIAAGEKATLSWPAESGFPERQLRSIWAGGEHRKPGGGAAPAPESAQAPLWRNVLAGGQILSTYKANLQLCRKAALRGVRMSEAWGVRSSGRVGICAGPPESRQREVARTGVLGVPRTLESERRVRRRVSGSAFVAQNGPVRPSFRCILPDECTLTKLGPQTRRPCCGRPPESSARPHLVVRLQ